MPTTIPKTVLIIGCGEFGASTALSLVKGAYKEHPSQITILDRSANPPANDAASFDYNKIVRQEYSDPIYARLAHDAMDLWRTPEWRSNYHETGVVVSVGRSAQQSTYISRALAANAMPGMETPGLRAYIMENGEKVAAVYPKGVSLGDFAEQNVYMNEAGGWADARGAVVDTVARIRAAGVKFVAGQAEQLIIGERNGKTDVLGVRLANAQEYRAELVILCTGSWTPTLVPELGSELLPTGQILGTIQLSPEEYARYKDVPVTRMIDNGFYIFPPTEKGIIKFAIHQQGYLNPSGALPSVPRTINTPGYENQQVPPEGRASLLRGLSRVYPELASKPWAGSRLCWYSDRPSGDWLIDYHERYPSLFIAAGCCGHAFKFMPILGEIIVQAINGQLSPEQRAIWAYHHKVLGRKDESRSFSSHIRLESHETARL